MNRRDFLRITGAAAAGAGIASLSPAGAHRAAQQPARRLLLVFCAGGWDTTYALDPKEPPHANPPAGRVQRFEGLDVLVDDSRAHVTEYFTRHAGVTAIVRGIATDAINHAECQRRIATGTREETKPDLGAIVAHDLGNDLPIPYLILGEVAFTGPYAAGSARLGFNNQIVELLGDPGTNLPGSTPAEHALLREYAAASAERARSTRGALGYNRRRVADFAESLDRGDRLSALRDRLGARGSLLGYEDQIPLALDAIEQGLSHSVMVSTRLPWDTHGDNYLQGPYHDQTFAGMTRIVDELVRRPGLRAGTRMIDDTVVVVFSEMSRGLMVGPEPNAGKDHMPITSAIVIGAGVGGGRVTGLTTPDGFGVPIDLSTGMPAPGGIHPLYSHFAAGILALCGVEPSDHFAATPVFDAFFG